MQIEQITSPNHEPRIRPISVLVYHATGARFGSALAWLTNPAARVSAHYLIGSTGRVVQLVDEAQTAWHAGVSQWQGLEVMHTDERGQRIPSINHASIGIELENLNTGDDPYPEPQLAAAAELGRSIIARRCIRADRVVRHADIAVPAGRKTDPAPPAFDWPAFRARLFTTEPVPAPAPPAVVRPYRARYTAYIRAAPNVMPGTRVVGTLERGEVFAGAVVRGQRLVNHLGDSDLWCQGARGYVWALQLEAV